jgi:ABC-type transport system substrate-binding protein
MALNQLRRSPHALMLMTALLILTLACGTAAKPTPEPIATVSPPTETPQTSSDTAAPTAMPQETGPASDAMTVDPESAPAFAEYWNPPVEFYGEPVMGGTLRMIYEDPLEHGNGWGAYTGATSRLRAPTHNKLVDENPYNAGEIIPDLAKGWANHEDGQGITLFFHEGIQWHNGEPSPAKTPASASTLWLPAKALRSQIWPAS